MPHRPLSLTLSLFFATLAVLWAEDASSQDFDFRRDVRPILSETCFHCHGPDEATREADLRLDRAESVTDVIVPGAPDESELIRRIMSSDPDEQMPPAESRKELSAQQRELLAEWVRSGAEYQGHWAFTRPTAISPPESERSPRHSNPIDAFVRDRLHRESIRRRRRLRVSR